MQHFRAVLVLALAAAACADATSAEDVLPAARPLAGGWVKTVTNNYCFDDGFGVAAGLAVVPGKLVGLPDHPMLLVSGCTPYNVYYQGVAPFDFWLVYLDPLTGERVKTVTTTLPSALWLFSIALRASKGDLLVLAWTGSTDATFGADVYRVNPATGAATKLWSGPRANGVAWDATDGTIYVTADDALTLRGYSENGTPRNSLSCADCAGLRYVYGIAASGPNVFASTFFEQAPYPRLMQIDKLSGKGTALFTAPPEAGTPGGDTECDPVSFAASGQEVVWVASGYSSFLAMELPKGRCALGGDPLARGQCKGGRVDPTDVDGDALLDCWETEGGVDSDGDGTLDYRWPANERPSTSVRDIYLEIDYMTGHRPLPGAIDDVKAAFARAPLPIKLHVLVGEDIGLHAKGTAFPPNTAPASGGDLDFDELKRAWFGNDATERGNAKLIEGRRWIFHYSLWVHEVNDDAESSGVAEIGGNDFMVSLGQLAEQGTATRAIQAGTLMHELGHNLGLRHGGSDDTNHKPNYLSVMNYSFQFPARVPSRRLDFARTALDDLDEAHLVENQGIIGASGQRTAFWAYDARTDRYALIRWAIGSDGDTQGILLNAPIDWNRSGDFGPILFPPPDINRDGRVSVLVADDDWSRLVFDFRAGADFADGAHTLDDAAAEPDLAEEIGEALDDDHDGVPNLFDNCPGVANRAQRDRYGDGVGDDCRVRPVFECIDGSGMTRVAHFGYRNPGLQTTVPIGAHNQVRLGAVDRGQPTSFEPGRVHDAFQVRFPLLQLQVTWLLNGRAASAFFLGPRCDPRPWVRVSQEQPDQPDGD